MVSDEAKALNSKVHQNPEQKVLSTILSSRYTKICDYKEKKFGVKRTQPASKHESATISVLIPLHLTPSSHLLFNFLPVGYGPTGNLKAPSWPRHQPILKNQKVP